VLALCVVKPTAKTMLKMLIVAILCGASFALIGWIFLFVGVETDLIAGFSPKSRHGFVLVWVGLCGLLGFYVGLRWISPLIIK